MIEVTAYKCADGSIYENEDAATAHDQDLLGAELDGLLRLFELDITRTQQYKALLLVMKKRAELSEAVRSIIQILDHSEA